MQNYSSYHLILQAKLLQCSTRCHSRYLRGRRDFTLSLPAPEYFRPTDRKFQELKALEPTLPPMTRPPRPQCMSETSSWLIDNRTALRLNPGHNRNMAHKITKYVLRSLLVESRRITEKAAEEISTCLEPETVNPDVRGAYTVLKSWYHHASTRAPKPSWADTDNVTGDYAALYWKEELLPPPPSEDRYLHTSNPSGSMTMSPCRGGRGSSVTTPT